MKHLQHALTQTKQQLQIRKRWLIKNKEHHYVIVNGKKLLNFSDNDYLNLCQHPNIKQAFIQSVQQHGFGSGASALISGYSSAHQQTEEAFAEFLGREKALLFNSGYHANLGVLTTLSNRKSCIIADKYCHASLIDGFVLSRSKHLRYQHNDLAHAEKLLAAETSDKQNTLLVTESIFSMQGNITDIKKLAQLSNQYHAYLMVDDAHGFGVLGETGRGISEHFALRPEQIPCLVTPLGKATGGFGAMVSGNQDLIEALIQFARTYRYSTALPPALGAALREALKIIQQESWRREKLKHLIHYFLNAAKERHLHLAACDMTPIKSVLIGSNAAALKLQNHLFKKNLFVVCIRPPTVPKNTARIRISLNCTHTEEQIVYLLDQIKNYVDTN